MSTEMIAMAWAECAVGLAKGMGRLKVKWRMRPVLDPFEHLSDSCALFHRLGMKAEAGKLGHERRMARRKHQDPKPSPRRINGRLRRKV